MLPDYLAPNLKIVFVGINPGAYSARVGHYFARRSNLFWRALNASQLLTKTLTPNDDARVLEFGIGLTDLVKRATPNASLVTREEFFAGGKKLRAQLTALAPRVICFVGLTGYRAAFDRTARLGAQQTRWGKSYIYLVPSTSPRNARYRNEIVTWFKRLKNFSNTVMAREVPGWHSHQGCASKQSHA